MLALASGQLAARRRRPGRALSGGGAPDARFRQVRVLGRHDPLPRNRLRSRLGASNGIWHAVTRIALESRAGEHVRQAPADPTPATQITLTLDGELHCYVVVGDHEITLAPPDPGANTFRLG